VTSHRWLRLLLLSIAYLVVFVVVLGIAAEASDLAAGVVFAAGVALPMFFAEWRFLRELNARRPEHIVAALRKGQDVRVDLPRASSSAWEPGRGLFGRVSGPGVAEYHLVDDTSVQFRYRGRWGDRAAVTALPPVLVSGTPEAVRASSAKRRMLGAVLVFYLLLPAGFVVGYFGFGGHGSARAEHGSIAVLAVLGLYVIASRAASFALLARRRRQRSADQGSTSR
jgi:cytochrome c biogenesis protein CcdA